MSNNPSNDKHLQRNQRIKRSLSRQSLGFYDICENPDDEEYPILQLLHEIEAVVSTLPECKLPVFRLVRRHGQYTLKRGAQVRQILQALEDIPKVLEQCPEYEFNPYINAFISHAYHHDVVGITRDQVADQETIDRLNDFVDDVIDEILSPEFRLKQRRCWESACKNAESLKEYIDALIRRYPRLLVVRVDFGYQAQYLADHELDPNDVCHDKERLIRYAKRKFDDHLVGHAWKLEHGVLKSYHYHMVFILNGRERKGDYSIGQQLGDYWVNVITQGDGTTFNCNARKSAYQELAIGMVHRNDRQKRDNLKKHVVNYLTKNDDYMRLKIEAHGEQIRTFGRGVMPDEIE